MFSWYFLHNSISETSRFPSALIDFVRGRPINESLYDAKMKKWEKIRSEALNRKTELSVALPGGQIMILNPSDQSYVSSSIATTGWIDLALTSLLRKVIKPGMRAIDVGANSGYYTLLLSRLVGSTGKVYSFEPEVSNLSLLRKNVAANKLENVQVIDAALSEVAGLVDLYGVDPSRPNEPSLVYSSGSTPSKVRSETLDHFWHDNGNLQVDFIKNHVRGGENLVLRGGRKLIEEQSPMIAMVVVPENWQSDVELLSFLSSHYNFFKVVRSPRLLSPISKSGVMQANPSRGTELFLTPNKR